VYYCQVCKAVMRVFEANNQGYSLLERRISDEVAMADDEGTLFRANSIAAKLFGSYVRMTSLPFIWYTLVASVNSLNDNAIEAFGSELGTAPPLLPPLLLGFTTHGLHTEASYTMVLVVTQMAAARHRAEG
jgi:hypothetical protein